jgi:hypothetical protein
MCLNNNDHTSHAEPSATDEQPDMPRARPAIVILPPERDGDRDRLIAALAAAVVAIARERAASVSEPSLDTSSPHQSTAKTA